MSDDRIDQVDRLFSELQRRAFRMAAHLSRGTALTSQQYLALAHIGEVGHCTVNDLRAALGIAQSTASECVSRLERGSFVTKDRDAHDARSLRVELTPKGRSALRKREKAAREFYGNICARLLDTDQTALVASLETILKALDVGDPSKEKVEGTTGQHASAAA